MVVDREKKRGCFAPSDLYHFLAQEEEKTAVLLRIPQYLSVIGMWQ